MNELANNITKSAVYIRKSREDIELEAKGINTLQMQRDTLIRDVLSKYAFDYDVYEEVVSGDNVRDRPEFQKLLEGLQRGKYQSIVCKDLSRLGRGSYSDQGLIFDLIVDRRIYIITSDTFYDPKNFTDQRMIRFSLFFNREEYEMTVWRLTNGKYDGAKKGNWIAGSVPFGMQYNSNTQKLEANQNECEVVRLVFDLYANQGLGYRAISTKLKKMGIMSPKGKPVWQPLQIMRMLENRAYNGDVVFKKTRRSKLNKNVTIKNPESDWIVKENAHEPIIDESTWEKAQARLNETQSRPPVKMDFSPCELAGIVSCAECGKKMVRQYSVSNYHKKNGDISTYCKEYLYCSDCAISIKYRSVENQIIETLKETVTMSHDMFRSRIEKQMQEIYKDTIVDTDEIVVQLESKKKNLQSRIDKAMDRILDPENTLPTKLLEEQVIKHQTELEELEKQIEYTKSIKKENVDPMEMEDTQSIQDTMRSVLEFYLTEDDKSSKNELLRALFTDVKLHRIEKSRSKKEESKFQLYCTFKLTM